MVKRGSTYLRWAIMLSARLVSMRDPVFGDYLAKKRSEGKHYYVALSHVSRKLLRVIHHLLLSDTAFVSQL
jgi:transposase